MDCAPFIRTRLVLITWIIAPLLVLLVSLLAVRGFNNLQNTAYEQNRTLLKMIPRMKEASTDAAEFLKTYQTHYSENGSAQAAYISRFNEASQLSNFMIETMNLDPEVINAELGIEQMLISLQGTGTCREIATFLKIINEGDPLIVQKKIAMAPSGKLSDNLQVNMNLTRIYIETVQ